MGCKAQACAVHQWEYSQFFVIIVKWKGTFKVVLKIKIKDSQSLNLWD